MTLLQAFVLGLVQGLTEYLPVSSSAHLVFVPKLLGWQFPETETFIFDTLVQLGTLVGVVVYFWSDLIQIARGVIEGLIARKPLGNPDARLGWLVVLATIPASVIGLMFKSEISALFSSSSAAFWCLLVTAALLLIAERLKNAKTEEIHLSTSLWMGFAQALALLPGVSRSGSTIAAGMVAGASRRAAARFSFLMSIPVMVGASLVVGKDLFDSAAIVEQLAWPIVVGFITAAISGYIVIYWFLNFLKKQSLLWFALYCAVVGALGLIFHV
jgi:undecaprenyl-diphosphatase